MQSRSHTDQETCPAQGAGRSQDVAPPTGDVPVPGCWEEPGRSQGVAPPTEDAQVRTAERPLPPSGALWMAGRQVLGGALVGCS